MSEVKFVHVSEDLLVVVPYNGESNGIQQKLVYFLLLVDNVSTGQNGFTEDVFTVIFRPEVLQGLPLLSSIRLEVKAKSLSHELLVNLGKSKFLAIDIFLILVEERYFKFESSYLRFLAKEGNCVALCHLNSENFVFANTNNP